MLSPQALIKGLVARALPSRNADSSQIDVASRFDEYGGNVVASHVRKSHLLANEGSYFVANNAQTAITGQTTTAYDATKPSILIANTDSATNANYKRIFIDYIALLNGGTAYSNATSNTAIFWGVATDNGNRYSSAGSALTINNPNSDVAVQNSVAKAYAGAIVTTTATGALRTITAQRLMRMPVSATALTLANVDRFYFNFGGVELATTDNQLIASATLEATAVARAVAAPPVVIGPNQSFLFVINCVAGGAVTAGNFHYEIGWWER